MKSGGEAVWRQSAWRKAWHQSVTAKMAWHQLAAISAALA
jgi:hypothetical protein